MAKINDYAEVQSVDNLPESAMLVIEFGSNGGTKKISGKKFIEDLSGKVLDAKIPTKVSQLQNDAGYLTQHQDISGKADKTYVDEMIGDIEETLSEV